MGLFRSRCRGAAASAVGLLLGWVSVCAGPAVAAAPPLAVLSLPVHVMAPHLVAVSPGVVYGLPVAGAIVDPYRPPANRYGPGNRGVDLQTRPGQAVGAAADGVVVFAGQVGGKLFVVILHADGVRTTIGFLATITVRVGQVVRAGRMVGTAGTSVHFGARRGDDYIDPLSLIADGPPKVWLIPSHG